MCCCNTKSYSQVSNLEASSEAVPSQLSDVIVAQVQSFHRHQLSGPSAVNTPDLIVMSGKKKTHTEGINCG